MWILRNYQGKVRIIGLCKYAIITDTIFQPEKIANFLIRFHEIFNIYEIFNLFELQMHKILIPIFASENDI